MAAGGLGHYPRGRRTRLDSPLLALGPCSALRPCPTADCVASGPGHPRPVPLRQGSHTPEAQGAQQYHRAWKESVQFGLRKEKAPSPHLTEETTEAPS